MDRRTFMLGSATAGAGLLFGTSAFSAAGVEQGVTIETGEGYLHVDVNPDYDGDWESYVDDGTTPPALTIDDLAEEGWVRFDDLLRVTNLGEQDVSLYVEEAEDPNWLGDSDEAVLDYRHDGRTVVGDDADPVELDANEGDDPENSATLTVRADATGHDDLDEALPDEDARTVMFVAEAGDIDGGEGGADGISLLTTAPSAVDIGEDATLAVDLVNETSEELSTGLTVTVDGEEEIDTEVDVGAEATWSEEVDITDTDEETSIDWEVETDDDSASGTLGVGQEPTLAVDADDSVTVGSGNTFDVTATITDDDHGSGAATVTLDIEGDQLDPIEETVDVPEGGSTEATFDVQTVYDDLDDDNTEFGRHGDFRFDGTDWTVTVDYASETEEFSGTLEVEDAAVEWYPDDGDANCPVCNMHTEMYDNWHGQVTHVDGSRAEFCSTGCLVAYVVNPQAHYADVDVPEIAGAWVVDFSERPTDSGTELIDARDAHFVLDYEREDHMMGSNPPAFPSHEEADGYVDDHAHLEESDVVTFDEFDEDIAEEYRDTFL